MAGNTGERIALIEPSPFPWIRQGVYPLDWGGCEVELYDE